MYICRSIVTLDGETEAELTAKFQSAHDACRDADGFRWWMLLRSADNASDFASVSMWLTPEHEEAWRAGFGAPAATHRYDVTTARGSMTPTVAVAIVDWQVDPDEAQRFAVRWNAAYHAIEDSIGSRLLQNLDSPNVYAGLHAVTDPRHLDPKVLTAELTDGEGLSIIPLAVQRFDVVLLTEAP
jgi:heme-degrading monooxygenase HmoA